MYEELQRIVDESNKIVFFGGAGVSTESGIPDFRSVDGLYNQKYDYPPEAILSHTFYKRKPKEFFRFYREKILDASFDAQPNDAHYKLAELERAGKLTAVVTQNIDGLHQKAGSRTVFELHGSIHRNYCEKCGQFYNLDEMRKFDGIPICSCGGRIKPDVVLYEEMLDNDCVTGAVNAIANADTLIIAGTSMTVYPAAGLIQYFRGKSLVVINMSPTAADEKADLLISDKVGKVLSNIKV